MAKSSSRQASVEDSEFVEKVIQIDRVNKVVKGGKRMSFRALVIVGDLNGRVGIAFGKAKEVPNAIKKGVSRAKKRMKLILIVNESIPHPVLGKFGASSVILKPARPGTGVIAGGSVRILLEASGIRNIVAKSLGSNNALNAAMAAFGALGLLKDVKKEEAFRGVRLPVFIEKSGVTSVKSAKATVEVGSTFPASDSVTHSKVAETVNTKEATEKTAVADKEKKPAAKVAKPAAKTSKKKEQ